MNTEKTKKAIDILRSCKEKTIMTWKSGTQGKALCIGGALAVLLVLVYCCDGGKSKNDGEDSAVSPETGITVESARVGGVNSRGEESDVVKPMASNNAEEVPEEALDDIHTGFDGQPSTKQMDEGAWKYTGEDFEDAFTRSSVNESYNGVIYRHYANNDIKVFKASQNGCFVENDKYYPAGLVWVETQKRYEEGEIFGRGFYVRLGQMVDKNASQYEDTFARYHEVTEPEVLERIRAQVEAEEGKPVEVDVPVKSLCGFAIGTTPSAIEELCKSLCGNSEPYYDWGLSGELITPFRHCDKVGVGFSTTPPLGGRHLCFVKLSGEAPLESMQELREEVKTIVAMLEKKFGIKFEKGEENTPPHLSLYYINYYWETGGGEDCIPQSIHVGASGNEVSVTVKAGLMSPKAWNDWRESQRPPKLSADAGADQL
jgi:hypothetical protein